MSKFAPRWTSCKAAAFLLIFLIAIRAGAQPWAPGDPDDPYFEDQWGHPSLNLPGAWERITGNANVGLVDQGAEPAHPDLRPFAGYAQAGSTCYHFGSTFEGGNLRAQHSGYFASNPAFDTCNVDEYGAYRGHGTHVAGIVAATTDNGIGGAGVCPGCNILAASHSRASTPMHNLAAASRALTFLVDHGAQIVSMSFNYDPEHPDLDDFDFSCPSETDQVNLMCNALEYATERDVILVASAGNNRIAPVGFPASDARVWAIGGIEPDGDFWDFDDDPEMCPCDRTPPGGNCIVWPDSECGSQFGSPTADLPGSQDLVAPAVAVVSTFYPDYDWSPLDCHHTVAFANGYGACTGTSMSAPFLAGIAGLVRSTNPLLDRDQVRDALIKNASLANAFDDQMGYGIPDAGAAVSAVLGRSGGQELTNRLTPLFRLYSSTVTSHLFTTQPQVASASIGGVPYGTDAASPALAPLVGGYSEFPGVSCSGGGCSAFLPRASVFLFVSGREPWAGAPDLVPLYRMSKNGSWNSSFFYATTIAEIEAKGGTYQVDGIEGYVFEKPGSGSVCTVPGTVKLIRLYKSGIDDFVVVPASEESAYRTASYDSVIGLGDWIGCAYPNVDSDSDDVIDGFEDVAGTNPLDGDSDCDSDTDGEELLEYDSNGYGDPLAGGSCLELNTHILDTFTTGSGVNGRTTETGGVNWTATSAAKVSGAKMTDQAAIGTVPFVPTAHPIGHELQVHLDVDPTSSEWIATGFTGSSTASFVTAGELWVQIKGAGTYAVFVGTTQVATGSLPGTPTGGYHDVMVQYQRSTLNGRVDINGVTVYNVTLGGALTGIQHAGFQFYRSPAGGGKIDNFDITVKGASSIADTFTGSGQINGRTTTTGSATWTSGPAVINSGYVTDPDAIGGVPFDPTELPGNPTVVVEGDVNPATSTWGGIGFSSSAGGAYWVDGQLWAVVRSDGNYAVHAGGSQVASAAIPGSPVGGFSTIRIQYRPSTLAAVVKINGVQVYSGTLGSAPIIQYAGFHFLAGADGSGGLDNFEVLATSAP